MDGHLALCVTRHAIARQHRIEPPAHRRARGRLGRAVGGFLLVVGARLGQVGDLAQGEQALPQGLGRKLDGPVNAVVGEWAVEGRAALALSLALGLCRLLKGFLPLAVTEARAAVEGERVDDVVEALLPGSLGRPRSRLVV